MAIATINPATGQLFKAFQPLSDSQNEAKLKLAAWLAGSGRLWTDWRSGAAKPVAEDSDAALPVLCDRHAG